MTLQSATAIVNETPLTLALAAQGRSNPITVSPFGRVDRSSWPEGTELIIMHPQTGAFVRALTLGAGQEPRAITPDMLPRTFRGVAPVLPHGPGVAPSLTCVNATSLYVQIYRPDSEEPLTPPLAPGDHGTLQTWTSGDLLYARSTFSRELVAGYVCLPFPRQTFEISEDFRSERLRQALAPIVPGLRELTLVGQPGPLPKPNSHDYLAVSEFESGTKAEFNGRVNVVTKAIRICGATLVWDDFRKDPDLMQHQGAGRTDLESVEIFADHVVIASPVRFPGANVTIWARVLEFQGKGALDTTPLAFAGQAISSRTVGGSGGDPSYPANADGSPRYLGEDGRDGQAAGHIALNVREIRLPAESGPAAKRFVARGATGQTAEPGGRKPYAKRRDDQPSNGPDLPSVTGNDVLAKLAEVMPIAKKSYQWRWPGEKDWPWHVKWEGIELLPEKPKDTDHQVGNVTGVKLVAIDASMASADANVMYFPSGKRKWHGAFVATNGHIFDFFRENETSNTRPGDGRDAYPGGKPGDGGRGGDLVTSLPKAFVQSLADLAGGAAGAETPAVPGGAPGKPHPAYRIQMAIIKKTPPFESWLKPAVSVEEVSACAGEDAPAITGEVGAPGDVIAHAQSPSGGYVLPDGRGVRLPSGQAALWAHPAFIDAVIACATDAYRNGHREFARSLIEPYDAELRLAGDIGSDLEARAVSIAQMRKNLLANLDYYGNPPGWVPRLQAETNFAVFREMRKISSELLLFARSMLDAYERRDVTAVKGEELKHHLSCELELRQAEVKSAANELERARGQLESLTDDVALVEQQIANIRTWVTDQAQDKVRAQRIFKGMMKLVAGTMKVIPAGQPYLGLAGDVFSAGGEFNWNAEDPSTQFGPMFKKIGGKVDSFLKDNKDLIAKDGAPSGHGAAEERSLEQMIEKAKGAVADVEKKQAQAAGDFEKEWSDTFAEQIDRLTRRKDEIDSKIAQFSDGTSSEQTEERASLEAQRERLVERIGARDAGNLLRWRARVQNDIAELEGRALQASQAKATAEAERIAAEKEELEGFTSKLAALETKLQKLQKAEKWKAAETKEARDQIKDTVDRMKGLGNGIGEIGEAIATLASPVREDDPEVQAIVERILDSDDIDGLPNEQRDAYRKLMKDVEALAVKQHSAVSAVLRSQQALSTHLAGIAQALTALNDTSTRGALLSLTQDVRVKRHLEDMASRARDMVRWSLYHFIMAFRYEFLMDVPSDLLNIDTIVDSIAKQMLVNNDGTPKKDASGKAITLATIPRETYIKVEEVELKKQLSQMAQALVNRYEHWTPPFEVPLTCELDAPLDFEPKANAEHDRWKATSRRWLSQLRRDRAITVHPVDDLRLVDRKIRYSGARIKEILLKKVMLHVEDGRRPFDFTLRFQHSGEAVIYERTVEHPDGAWFYFQKGVRDDPVSWRFQCRWSDDGDGGKVAIVPDRASPRSNSMIATLLSEQSLVLKPYLPGLYAPWTIYLDHAFDDPSSFPDILRMELGVTIECTGP